METTDGIEAAPPAPKAMMPPPPVKDKAARTAAVAAAAAAAASVAPGQRERAIERAAVAALASAVPTAPPETAAAADAGATETGGVQGSAHQGAPPSYTPPDWAGVPEGVDYSIEVLKNGSIIETRHVSSQDHYTFGRTPVCDFPLEHPSASRLHAVLQYKQETREAYLYDNNSTHGTWVNKQRIKPGVFVPLRVGDTIKFGQSSRMLVLCGPDELRPPEGLTRSAKLQLAQLEYSAKMKAKDLELSKSAMDAALSGDVSWGMGGGDAIDEDALLVGDVDWRALATAGKLTDKQQKIAEKIRQKEYKIKNIQTETDRITAKERQEGGLTAGQATTLARNQQSMDKLQSEIEDLEEALIESVKDSIIGKSKASARAAEAATKQKKRGTTASDDEYLEGSDSDDDFYDRTAGSRKKLKGGGGGKPGEGGKAAQAVQQVESAQSLYGKREVLSAEQVELQAAIQAEEARLREAANSSDPQGAGAGAEQQEGGTSMQVDGGGAAGVQEGGEVDALDQYMSNMETQLEENKLASLKTRLSQVITELARCEKLLRIADPDGWLRPGSKAAQEAKAAAMQRMEAQRRREAAAAAAAKTRSATEASFQVEVEVEEVPPGPTGRGSAGETTQQQQPGAGDSQQGPGSQAVKAAGGTKPVEAAPPKNTVAAAEAARLIAEFSTGASQHEAAGGRSMPSVRATKGLLAGWVGEKLRAGASKPVEVSAVAAAAAARVAEDIGALSAAEQMRQELEELKRQEEEEAKAAELLAAERSKQSRQQELQQKLGY